MKHLLFENILMQQEILPLEDRCLHKELAMYINQLIITDFDELIFLLYRVDVNESLLKKTLKENHSTDAGEMIATLVIERQIQKIKSRREHRQDINNVDENDRW